MEAYANCARSVGHFQTGCLGEASLSGCVWVRRGLYVHIEGRQSGPWDARNLGQATRQAGWLDTLFLVWLHSRNDDSTSLIDWKSCYSTYILSTMKEGGYKTVRDRYKLTNKYDCYHGRIMMLFSCGLKYSWICETGYVRYIPCRDEF